MIQTVFNILAICGAAGFSGVMLCIGVTLGGYWRSLPPEEFLTWFAANNHFVSNTIPLIVGPTLIGLGGSLWAGWGAPGFALWVASSLCMLVVLGLTFAYFVPTNAAFASKSIEVAATAAKLDQWLMLHNLRIGVAMIGAILGCIALKISA
ncbi:Domain protein of unknown function [Phaeobacter piscinae]|uniref:Uncharacterized protein n=1 Tax=Phaeobacter piscinae TaxID=1580596 RepID=A0AAN1GSQ7_9RHOB|nr:DUF1772 domain-containing protein [Phaeobacter piscinae]ATG44290.1 Domain protein of unknown function [Phaeobacter piscinae]AUR36604.1 Domain protein of unknown function [Phaeobacter piscinae]